MSNKEYVWAELYRPSKLDDVIIPESIKFQFKQFIADGQLPNLLLTSTSPGTGKTTTAYALCAELDIKPLFLNASLNNSIDDIRTTVMNYATTMSIFGDGQHKVIIFDEGDRLSAAAQDALKGIIEEVSTNCRFIITANTKSKIIEPLQSRLTNIDFRFPAEEAPKLIMQMFKRVLGILDENKIEYDNKAVANIVKSFYPDNRRLLTFLHKESKSGKIDEGSLSKATSVSPEALIEAMKGKKYNDVKSYLLNNADRLNDDFYGRLFKMLETKLADQSVPQLVLILGDYQKFDTVVPDKYLHFLAMCTEIMMGVTFR